jgi:O-antigen ligase
LGTIVAPAEQQDDSREGRLHFWQVAIAMANDRPIVGVGHRGYEPAYNDYDFSDGLYGRSRAVHSAWFGVLGELGYPGLVLFAAIIISSLLTCRRVRLAARRGELSDTLGAYAIALESSLVAFLVGGSFVSFHYCEMLWHFFALSVALERVAVTEAAAIRARREEEERVATARPPVPESDGDFAWA